MRSSAKKRWESLGPLAKIFIGLQVLEVNFLSILNGEPFHTNDEEVRGDGVPCLIPLEGLK